MNNNLQPAIITFPGSNCERDVDKILRTRYHCAPYVVWHNNTAIPHDTTHVILPGGFSFGDYLRAGALAAISPIMKSVHEFALVGKPVLGICNGFQILCEAKLLPGMLLRNHHDRFVCSWQTMTWSSDGDNARKINLPIAHRDGRYFAEAKTLLELKQRRQIILSYDDRDEYGHANVNGSMLGIAGIVGGPRRNIIGLMPHPERAVDAPLGNSGALILDAFVHGVNHEA